MRRFDLPRAWQMAEIMRRGWVPCCERIVIAGSVRRHCATVKDVELVAIPRWTEAPAEGQGDLFAGAAVERVNLLQRDIESMVARGGLMVIKPGVQEIEPWTLKADGRYWRLYVPEIELKIDLFLTTRETWGLIVAIRTGSGAGPDGSALTGFSAALLRRWKAISSGGYAREGLLHTAAGELVPTPEERDVFKALRLRWVPPVERRSDRDVAAACLRG